MNWGSFSAFVAMGGYGPYVWGSFGLAAAAFVVEWILVRQRRAAIVGNLKRRLSAARMDGELA
jgi:heme exporter protein D